MSNISRGQILVQEALVAALRVFEEGTREGKTGEELRGLRGAALDVTDPEPLPEGHELWDAPNCIVTPHISGLGSAYADRAFQVLVSLSLRSFFPSSFSGCVGKFEGGEGTEGSVFLFLLLTSYALAMILPRIATAEKRG